MTNTKLSTSCIIEHNHKILMIREEQDGKIAWDIPAGGLDQGEDIYQGVLREVHEEAGLIISNPENKKIFQYIEKNRTTVNFLFYIKLDDKSETHSDNQDIDEDIIDIRWFTLEQIKKMITEGETENSLATARLQSWIDSFPEKKMVDIIYE